jgi:hypothetical protein
MAFLTMRSDRQLGATAGNGFGLCRRLRPRGSTKAPSQLVSAGYAGESMILASSFAIAVGMRT